MNCPSCGFQIDSNWRLCPNCGTSLAAPKGREMPKPPQRSRRTPTRSRAAPVEEERKVVTVLFADISGFTSLSEKLDPEELKDFIDNCFLSMRKTIESFGGYIDKYLGDAIMAIFGAPEAHEDDAERAVRAALEIRKSFASREGRDIFLPPEIERDIEKLQVRAGINTGEVVAGSPAGGRDRDYTVLGDTVNVAKRLQESAPIGGILISKATHRLIPKYFLVKSIPTLDLKGKTKCVDACLVEGISEKPLPPPDISREIPMVGRDEELNFLLSLSRDAFLRRRPKLIIISGEAGIGKSILFHEFSRSLSREYPGLVTRLGHSPHFGGSAFAPFAEIIRSHFSISPGDGPETILSKLAGRVEQHALARLIGLSPKGEVETLSPEESRRQIFWAAKRLFESAGRLAPLIIAIEDSHFSDPSTLDLVSHITEVSENSALMTVLLGRDEFHENFADWEKSRRDATILKLGPLRPKDVRSLVRKSLEMPDSKSSTSGPRGRRVKTSSFIRSDIAAIEKLAMDKSAGNPLFIEKLLESLIEDETLVRATPPAAKDHEPPTGVEPTGWRLAMPIEEVRVPDTLYGVIAARLDRLLPYHKRILQRASIVGRTFSKRLIEHLMAREYQDTAILVREVSSGRTRTSRVTSARLDMELEHLDAARFVQKCPPPPPGTGAAPQTQDTMYTFRETLTQDVAYNSLFKKVRRQLHRLAAEWIEENRASNLGDFYPMLARQYREAGQTLKAIDYYEKSGDSALDSFSLLEASSHYSQAISLLASMYRESETIVLPRPGYQPDTAREESADSSPSELPPDEERASLADDADYAHKKRLAELYRKHAGVLCQMGRTAEAIKIADCGLAIASRLRDARSQSRLLSRLSEIHRRTGDLEGALRMAKQALDVISATADDRAIADILLEMATINIFRGAYDDALALARKAASTFKESRDLDSEAEAMNRMGAICFYKGLYPDALKCYERCRELYTKLKRKSGTASVLNNVATLHYAVGNYDQALATCQESLTLWGEMGHPWGMAATLSNIALAHRARGESSEALTSRQRALEIAREIGDRYVVANNLNSIGGIHFDLENYDEAQKCFDEALEVRKLIEDREGMATTLTNIGGIYHERGMYEDALLRIESSLKIHDTIGSTRTKWHALDRAANVYADLGRSSDAQTYANEALMLARRLRLLREEAESLITVGRCLALVSKCDEALTCYSDALSIAEKLSAKEVEFSASLGIAEARLSCQSEESCRMALSFARRAKDISALLSRPPLRIEALAMETRVLAALNEDFTEPLSELASAVTTLVKPGKRRKCHNTLAWVFYLRGDKENAQKHLCESRSIKRAAAERISDVALRNSFLDQSTKEEPHFDVDKATQST